jgi:hypothetical protein
VKNTQKYPISGLNKSDCQVNRGSFDNKKIGEQIDMAETKAMRSKKYNPEIETLVIFNST